MPPTVGTCRPSFLGSQAEGLQVPPSKSAKLGKTLGSSYEVQSFGVQLGERLGHDAEPLVYHSDRGVQYLDFRYTRRLALAGIEPSVGSRGDSYDNALAESIIGLYKTELVLPRGPWSRLEDLELATLEWVWWFNNHRLLKPIGLVPPAEYEAAYYLRLQTPPELETLNTHSLQ